MRSWSGEGSLPARHLFRVLAVAIPASVVLSACGGAGSPDLAGRSFVTETASGHSLVEGSTITLTFEDEQVSANAGCNTLTGAATWENDELLVEGPMAMTMMACEPDLMEQDEWLSTFLTSQPAVSVDGTNLTLGDNADGLTLTEKE